MQAPPVAFDLGVVVTDPATTHDLLSAAGLPMAKQAFAPTIDTAASEATSLGYPVALKASKSGLIHKNMVGGVRLNLRSATDVMRAAAEMGEEIDGLDGYVAQEMIPGGLEMVVGLKRDPSFGTVVMVGLGGALVEVIGDVALRLTPVDEAEAMAMIYELRVASTTSLGLRGGAMYAHLVRVITLVSELAKRYPDIVELDLNPVIVTSDRAVVVDAKLLRATRSLQTPAPRRAADTSIKNFLRPESIVVVGASANPQKQGGRLFHYLVKHGYPGRLFAVNPHAREVMGHTSYGSLDDLPESPDLACIIVPVDDVNDVLADCGRRGIPAAIVFTSGFAESDSDGVARQVQLSETAERFGIRLCGPNTAGLMHARSRTCAAFGMAFEVDTIPEGNVAMISQSGAIGSALLSRAWDEGVAVGTWICTGNEADLTLSDYMLALADDPSCRAFALFMETVRDPETFKLACRRARENGKHVLVYKSGWSAMGSQATRTHTGAIAGDDSVYDAAFKAYGVVRVPDLQGLLDAAAALSKLPLPAGGGIGVISASGGACSVVADECAKRNLDLVDLAPDTVRAIARIVPPFGVATNPIDVTMEVTVRPAMLGQVAELVLRDPAVDSLLVMLTTNADPAAAEVAVGVIAAAKRANKPVVVSRMGAEFLAPMSLEMYRNAGIPVFAMPERAVLVLRALADAAAYAAPAKGEIAEAQR